MERISWGVLSTAKIGLRKVIPALQKGNYSEVIAIASRDFEKAQQATKKLGIPKAYGSYEELLADDEIANMKVIDRILESSEKGAWIRV